MNRKKTLWGALLACGIAAALAGCGDRTELVTCMRQREELSRERDRLRRQLESTRDRSLRLERQVQNLKRLGRDRPIDLFAPQRIEIVERSGGRDYDDQPGDDGVTVYVRPLDPDGYAVKAPGEIQIQLLDNTSLGKPRVLGYCVYNDPEQLREMWYGRFGTDHYTAECRFSPGTELPESGRVQVNAKFIDYLSGRTLTASEEVRIDLGGKGS